MGISAIIDFLYNGEANVYQENLDSFLSIAEELQLRGLEGKGNDNEMIKTSKKSQCGNSLYKCTMCGKEDRSYNLKNHIENNHLEGVSIPCNFCEKTFRCTKSLGNHNNSNHEMKIQVKA